MKIKSIQIKNYKSIENICINFGDNKHNAELIGFLGLNESGKSNILQAVSVISKPEDFEYADSIRKQKKGEPIEVVFHLENMLTKKDIREFIEEDDDVPISELLLDPLTKKDFELVTVIKEAEKPVTSIKSIEELNRVLEEKETKDSIAKKIEAVRNGVTEYIMDTVPSVIFWKSESKYLMSGQINMESFKANPRKISIPLTNCFRLSGVEEESIGEKVSEILSDPIEEKNFLDHMDKEVTKFVREVWKEHPVSVGFAIQGKSLTFTVKDDVGKHGKVDDRSDGFRQFISFLLTAAAEVQTGILENSILLIDEPETHLHPTAQEFLRDELKRISEKNIVLFATHSSYLIDKTNFSQYYSVTKNSDLSTQIDRFEDKETTFSEINYEVFNIPTTDYHNELYGWCLENEPKKLKEVNPTRSYIEQQKGGSTKDPRDEPICTYIRHQIHHPENEHNKRFSPKELKQSIEIMRAIRYG